MKTSHLLVFAIVTTGAFYIGGFVALGGSHPTIDSSGDEIVRWFSDHAVRARTYAWTGAFVSLGLGIFGGLVCSVMPAPHRFVFLAGILGSAVTAQVQAWIWAGLAFDPQGLEPAAARMIFAVACYWGPLVNGSMATMAVAVAALGFGASRMVPRWLMWLSLVFCLEQVVETATVFGRTGFLAPGGAMNVYLGGVLGLLWVAAVTRWAAGQMNTREGSAETPS